MGFGFSLLGPPGIRGLLLVLITAGVLTSLTFILFQETNPEKVKKRKTLFIFF